MEKIAEQHNLDEALTWAIILSEKTDEERLELFSKETEENSQSSIPCYYNDWHYYVPDQRLGYNNYFYKCKNSCEAGFLSTSYK